MHPKQVKWLRERLSPDQIVISVNSKYMSRSEGGQKKYGTTLFKNNVDNYLQHLQEELMDGTLYIEKLIQQKQHITYLTKFYSNDADLGKAIRKTYGNSQ